jgi:hypothetical protein
MNMQMKNSHDAVRKLISMQIQDFCGARRFTKKKKKKKKEVKANNGGDNSMIFLKRQQYDISIYIFN